MIERSPAQQANSRWYSPNAVIYSQGESGGEFYVLRQGRVLLRQTGAAGQQLDEEIGSGGFFGELSVITGQPREATAIALEPTQALVVDATTLEAMLSRNVDIALRVIHKLAGRLDSVNRRALTADDRWRAFVPQQATSLTGELEEPTSAASGLGHTHARKRKRRPAWALLSLIVLLGAALAGLLLWRARTGVLAAHTVEATAPPETPRAGTHSAQTAPSPPRSKQPSSAAAATQPAAATTQPTAQPTSSAAPRAANAKRSRTAHRPRTRRVRARRPATSRVHEASRRAEAAAGVAAKVPKASPRIAAPTTKGPEPITAATRGGTTSGSSSTESPSAPAQPTVAPPPETKPQPERTPPERAKSPRPAPAPAVKGAPPPPPPKRQEPIDDVPVGF